MTETSWRATSKKMNLPVSKISEHEETYSTSLFSMLLPLGSDSIAKQDEIYNVQKEVIREMAEKESCIIVGRCADYIFRDHRNVLNIYISMRRWMHAIKIVWKCSK